MVMKSKIGYLWGLILLLGCEIAEKQSLNMVVFIVDDMGWQDTSVPFWEEPTSFNQLYQTPNMERLAAAGKIFTQAYATSVCSPSRTSLMTGMNAARHRVTNWTLRRDNPPDARDTILTLPDWNYNGLQPVDSIPNGLYATTLPQILQANGYYTIHTGKAHWGAMNTPGSNPLNLGFDKNIAGHAAGGLGSHLGEKYFGNAEPGVHSLPWGVPGMEAYHGDSINLAEALTIEALKALDERPKDQPFYLYLSHYIVHIPLEPARKYYEKYRAMGLEEPEARYASMVEEMDASLGRLLQYLDDHQLSENTAIVFLSDNGGLSASARGGVLHTHNAPLNSGKGSAYEGGIRVPFIVKWPGEVLPNSRESTPIVVEDLFPTLLEMAGVQEYETVQEVDGWSLAGLFKDKQKLAERDLFWHYPNRWGANGPGIGPSSTIRSGDWKLIHRHDMGKLELYNLSNDIGESVDLSQENPEKVLELAEKLTAHLKKTQADIPTVKATGKPVPFPIDLL